MEKDCWGRQEPIGMELLHIIVKYNIPDSEGFYFYFYFNMTHTVYHINIMERYINQQTESIGI